MKPDPAADQPLPGTMPGRVPEGASQPGDFKPHELAKTLLRTTRSGTLATIDRNGGYPFASLTNVATDIDGAPVVLVSRLATHTANLERDGRASILLAEIGKGDALAHPRLTVLGTFKQIARDAADETRLRRRFLSRHPKSELYAGFADFAFWRLQTVSAHLNGGFARAADFTALDVLTDISDAQALIDVEESAVEHMNSDHAEALRLYATRLLGAPDGDWRCVGIDPEGLDLQRGQTALRLNFPHRIISPEGLRTVLKELAGAARAKG
jgi:putative heme iron utilization protein